DGTPQVTAAPPLAISQQQDTTSATPPGASQAQNTTTAQQVTATAPALQVTPPPPSQTGSSQATHDQQGGNQGQNTASLSARQATASPSVQVGSGQEPHSQQVSGNQGQSAPSPTATDPAVSNGTSQVKSNSGPTSPDPILGPTPTAEKNSGDPTRFDLANKIATLTLGVDRVRPKQGDALSRVGRWDTRLAAEAASIMGSMWNATKDATESGSSQEVDVLAESLPFDPVLLDRAIEDYLNQIDALGNTLVDLLRSDGPWPWLAGAVAASAAGTLAYQRARKRQSEPAALTDGEEMISSWFLDSTSNG
ncbi:MAG: hypothetical protein JO161_07145, partial [Planctomycetaceae bacterium]|nr:hypothetical protein [Planctomycetaceae bacterium]